MHWTEAKITAYFSKPLFELIFKAHELHLKNFNADEMELCSLLSIKTGACPEDCKYCSQSGHYNTGLKREKLLSLDAVIAQAKKAKQTGAKRFCLGAAWKYPPKKDFPKVLEMIKAIKALGLETCVTLGRLDQTQAKQLKAAGLDFYSHNIDTSERYYREIITTRCFQDRLDTLQHVADADINICCGGIMGMGETKQDRIQFLLALYQLPKAPKSIPINKWMIIKGTPIEASKPIETFELVKMIAITRLMFPTSKIRLGAGRETLSHEAQALMFMAGANSIFIGDRLLTTNNPSAKSDMALLEKLNFTITTPEHENLTRRAV